MYDPPQACCVGRGGPDVRERVRRVRRRDTGCFIRKLCVLYTCVQDSLCPITIINYFIIFCYNTWLLILPPPPSSTATEGDKPQLLLFSATVPSWVQDTADRYMSQDKVLVDLIGQQSLRTAVTVEHLAICCPYAERPSTIADVIQVR